MKKTLIGITFTLTGVYLYASMHANAVTLMPSITQWDNRLGRYGQALANTNSIFPLVLGIALGVFGLGVLLKELFGKE